MNTLIYKAFLNRTRRYNPLHIRQHYFVNWLAEAQGCRVAGEALLGNTLAPSLCMEGDMSTCLPSNSSIMKSTHLENCSVTSIELVRISQNGNLWAEAGYVILDGVCSTFVPSTSSYFLPRKSAHCLHRPVYDCSNIFEKMK